MECYTCHEEKLPNEYPPENVTTGCRHAPLHCLRCTIGSVKSTSKCPHPECEQTAALTDRQLQWFQAILKRMFYEYRPTQSSEPEGAVATGGMGGTITVTLLTGESTTLAYNPNMQVMELKRKLYQEFKHDVEKQKLLYNDTEITNYKSGGKLARISDFGVKPNSSLCLVILLFSIPKAFDKVVFDLFWGYPSRGQDFLDASCLVFSNQSNIGVIDYCHRQLGAAVYHSGDVMDHAKRLGHHTINVSLQQIPDDVTHLFFTLSAWNSPTIASYPNPSLKFYEASKPTEDLCKTAFTHAGHSQAVVMCSVSRGAEGNWQIFESGKLSAGNAKYYNPLTETIRELIRQGF